MLRAMARFGLNGLDGLDRIAARVDAPRLRLVERQSADVRSILVWTMDRMGDVLRTTPAIRSLKKRYPHARLGIVTAGRGEPIFVNNPAVDCVVQVPSPHAIGDHWQALRQLQNTSWDLGLLLEVNQFWAKLGQWYFRALKVRRYAMFDFGWQCPVHAMSLPLSDGSWIDQFNDLAELVGTERDSSQMELHLSTVERERALDILAERQIHPGEPFFLIHPGGNFNTVSRQWSPAAYADLINLMAKRWPFKVVLTGLPREQPVMAAIQDRVRAPLTNLCGALTVRELMAVIEQSRACIMNDTGPLHIAHALKVPTVVVLGPTSPHVVGIPKTSVVVRLDLPCSPCAFLNGWKACQNVKKWECLEGLSAEHVFKSLVWLMEQRSIDQSRLVLREGQW